MSEQVKQEGTFKVKRPKKLVKKDGPIKVDLSKINQPKEEEKDAVQVGETKEVAVEEQTGDSPQVDKPVSEPQKVPEDKEEKPIIEEVIEEEKPVE